MAGKRPILSLIAMILLAGGIVFQFFVILSGAVSGGFEDRIYFLQADTSGIPGAPNPARWTFFALCGVDSNGHNSKCQSVHAALPFNPTGKLNFDTEKGVPSQFISGMGSLGKTGYYLSRCMFAFYLISLFFAVCALALSLVAMCARLGAKLAGLTTFLALLFQAVTASLMTSWTVLGEKAFKSNGQKTNTKLGEYAYGFTWAAFACFLISTILLCIGGRSSGDSGTGGGSSGRGLFGRKKSTKSNRGSFLDSEDGGRRGVKDEYD